MRYHYDYVYVFLGSTYLEEERYTYERNGEIENFPDRLKKEIFNVDIPEAEKEVTKAETNVVDDVVNKEVTEPDKTKHVQVDDDFVNALKDLASDNFEL